MTIIEQIKAEIEKLIEKYGSVKAKGVLQEGYKGGRLIGYEDALNILKRIQEESEKLIDGLEEEVHNYLKIHHLHIKDGGRVVFDNDDIPNFMCDVRNIARHFAQWGAEHLKK